MLGTLVWLWLAGVSSAEANNVTDLVQLPDLTLTEVISWLPSAAEILRYGGSNDSAAGDCRAQSLQLLQSAERLDPMALKMLDSWAKFPSGILRGNVNQLGDFDECTSAGGRYCLTTAELRLPPALADVDSQLHSQYAITSSVDDPGHRLPRFSVVHWAVCVPSSCSSHHLQSALDDVLARGRGTERGVVVRARVDPSLCQSADDPPVMSQTVSIFGWSFFFVILSLCLSGTIADVISSKLGIGLPSGKLQQTLEAFSLRRNIRSLLDAEAREGEVASLHGARALNALGLLLSHKQMALMFLPFANRTDLAQVIGKSWSMIGRTAILYTDSFILISGLLSARTYLKDLSRTGTLNWVDSLISRVIRLTPSLAALIVFCSAVLPSLGSGPMWGLLVNKYASLCHSYWWRNLLFIHNHFPFTQMCLTHSHQVGIDMQLFLMAPLLVYVLWSRPTAGAVLLLAMSVWSSVLRYTITLSENLATVIYYGVPISQLFRTAEKTYILPSHRATVYCIGIALGYFIHRYKTCKLSQTTVVLGWMAGVSCGLLSMFGPYHMSWPDYVYNPWEAAVYNAVAPVLWSLFVGWAVFASHYGYGGWFGRFLGWRWFSVFTKLSYAIYLTQFPIFFYNVARARTSQNYSFLTLLNVPEFVAVLMASVVLTLVIDLPAQNLKKTFLLTITGKHLVSMTKDGNVADEISKRNESAESTPKKETLIVQRRRPPGSS